MAARTTNLLSPAAWYDKIIRRAPGHPSATSDWGATPGRRRSIARASPAGTPPNATGRLIPKWPGSTSFEEFVAAFAGELMPLQT